MLSTEEMDYLKACAASNSLKAKLMEGHMLTAEETRQLMTIRAIEEQTDLHQDISGESASSGMQQLNGAQPHSVEDVDALPRDAVSRTSGLASSPR